MTMTRRPNVHRLRHDATTWTLVEDVTAAAHLGAANMRWPSGLPRSQAAEIAHAYAAGIDYQAENGTQFIRAPWVTAEHGRADCKSTAVLIASLCAAAGRRVHLKFLQYTDGPTHWAHVYAVVDGTPVDPLLPFGQEYPYLRSHLVRIA